MTESVARWTSAGRRMLLAVLQARTATDLARRCRCTVATISALATGKAREPSLGVALALQRQAAIAPELWETDRRLAISISIEASGATKRGNRSPHAA
jgi:hypothetical protein